MTKRPLPMLKDEYGRYLQSWQLLPKLGYKAGHKLPDEGFGPISVEDCTFLCEPVKAPIYNHRGRRVKSSRHRLFFRCHCQKWIPCGRAGQHVCRVVYRSVTVIHATPEGVQ